MVLTQWLPAQSRNGSGVTPAIAITAGVTSVYVQLDTGVGDFTLATQSIQFEIQWSSDGGNVFAPLASGGFVGGPITTKSGSGLRYISVPPPVGCTHMRANYVISGGPIRFGISGDLRTT